MIIDCRKLASEVDEATRSGVSRLGQEGARPQVVEIIATDDQSVGSYSATKARKAASLGIGYTPRVYEKAVTAEEILKDIREMNADESIHGMIVGLPLFAHLDEESITNEVRHQKDIDGLGAFNTYFVANNREDAGLAPATALAAVHILGSLGAISGKRVVVVGRGPTVGRPVAQMLINRDATVSIAHSRTRDLERMVRGSEIVVSATGRRGLIDPNWISHGQVVVDCGISFVDGKTVGDVDSAAIDAHGGIVTPVPGGVGVMTNAMLFSNLLKALRLQQVSR
jgi:methylenetetrahydrofolate dehydrogenase (NADP+) / methenyltetrahydrofolate cyclohydrolase